MPAQVIIGADLVPTASNKAAFEQGAVDRLVDPALRDILEQAGYRIFNLEVPLTDRWTPIEKSGPHLIASPQCAHGISKLGADFLTLANNHIFDQGEPGLASTLRALEAAGIASAGAGTTPEEAARPFLFETGGKKIGVYACAEHEFSIVSNQHGGANPFDPLESLDHIAALKQETDYVIVLYHGGKEHYRYPSPNLQKTCRKCIDKGADLVICQHTHCIGCEERYRNGTIVYGQGNFLFDYQDNAFWQTSLLVSLDEDWTVRYIPCVKEGSAVRLASGERGEEILREFFHRSDQIQEEGFLEAAYGHIAEAALEDYIGLLQGERYRSFLFRAINKLSGHRLRRWLLKRHYRKAGGLCRMLNVFQCEVHRECLETGLKQKFCEKD